jgi:hypothetical protein
MEISNIFIKFFLVITVKSSIRINNSINNHFSLFSVIDFDIIPIVLATIFAMTQHFARRALYLTLSTLNYIAAIIAMISLLALRTVMLIYSLGASIIVISF